MSAKTFSNDHFSPAAQGGDEWGRHVFGKRWSLVKWIMDVDRNSFDELIRFTAVFHDGHEERYEVKRLAAALTSAQRVSALLHDDGQTWEADDGRGLDRLARDFGAWHRQRSQGAGIDCDIYTFDDGSRIIACEGGWDLGFTDCDCLCWVGAGHADDCPES